jgi:hypothetical protein
MIIVSIMALFLGWSSKPLMAIDSAQYSLRRWVARFSVLAISGQALLFIALWAPLVHHLLLLRQSFAVEVLLFLVAVPSLAGGALNFGGGLWQLPHFRLL